MRNKWSGLNVGDEKEIKVKFPEDYREKSLAGKKCKISTKNQRYSRKS